MGYSQRDFFQAVLPDSGFVAVGRLAPRKGAYFEHDIYSSVSELITAVADVDYTKENYYFAISSFAEKQVFERGKSRFRTQSNAKLTKCIILDIDIKNEDGYFTEKDDAWNALQTLTTQLNLPDPIIVDSGYGYHVYWPMLAGVPSKEWQAVTKLFYRAVSVLEPRIVADASRVSDSASVLRIPDTFNLKFGQRVPVTIAQWYSDLLDFGEFKETLRRIVGHREGEAKVSLETAPVEYEKVGLLPLVKNCDWTKDYLTNAATASEPQWYAMMGLASFIEHEAGGQKIEGVDIAHLLSKKHPGYSHDATVLKFTQAKHGQTGPTTCAKLQQINKAGCEKCPFKGAVKSPVQAAKLQRPAQEDKVVTTTVITDDGNKKQEEIIIPKPPRPYFRGENGGVFVRAKTKEVDQDGNETWSEQIVQVYDYDLYPVKRFRSELIEEEHIEIHLWLPKDGVRRFKMPADTLVEHKKLGTFLAGRGALGEMGSSPRIAKYLIDYVRHMQQEARAEVEYSRFGWRDIDSEDPKFVVGNGYVDKQGTVHTAAFPSYLRSAATAVAAHGDIARWKEGFSVYSEIPNSEAYIFTALMGFAAPLMALTQYAGVLYNMVGQTGAGKSAALSIMSSVWGQPTAARVNVNDTAIATYNTIGYLNSVPVAFDEITTMDAATAAAFALNFTGGRGKERAGRDGQNKENNITWDTIVVCSSNTSMYNKFSTARKGYNAEAMRLFEVKVPPADRKYKDRMDKALALLRENYGHAGRQYIGSVMRNRDELKKAIAAKTNRILVQTGGSNAERFWATLVACVSVGAAISRKLGLHDYDPEAICNWAVSQVREVRDDTVASSGDPRSVLFEYINAHLSELVRIKDGALDIKHLNGAQLRVSGRLEYEGDTLAYAYISSTALSKYCATNNTDTSWLIQELKRLGVTDGKNAPIRLASGTSLPNGSTRSYKFDMRKQLHEQENPET